MRKITFSPFSPKPVGAKPPMKREPILRRARRGGTPALESDPGSVPSERWRLEKFGCAQNRFLALARSVVLISWPKTFSGVGFMGFRVQRGSMVFALSADCIAIEPKINWL